MPMIHPMPHPSRKEMKMSNFYNIPQAEFSAMSADMDAAASAFWAYPGEGWQLAFEEQWLRERGHIAAAAKAAESAA